MRETASEWYRPSMFAGTCSELGCHDGASWCNMRQTAEMAAPGFYYYCEAHGNARQRTEARARVDVKRGARTQLEDLSSDGCLLEARALRTRAEMLLAQADAYERRARELD